MDKNRIIALTDGIIAIAATIMVLELEVPEELTTASLLGQWPVLLAYIVSFSQIYLAWRSHHNSFQKADVVSVRTFLINGIWLFPNPGAIWDGADWSVPAIIAGSGYIHHAYFRLDPYFPIS